MPNSQNCAHMDDLVVLAAIYVPHTMTVVTVAAVVCDMFVPARPADPYVDLACAAVEACKLGGMNPIHATRHQAGGVWYCVMVCR